MKLKTEYFKNYIIMNLKTKQLSIMNLKNKKLYYKFEYLNLKTALLCKLALLYFCVYCALLAIEPNVARPRTAVKRRGGHTTHEVSHCLLY